MLSDYRKLLQGDFKQIWYKTRLYRKHEVIAVNRTNNSSATEILSCPKLIREIVVMNYYFNLHEGKCNKTCRRPWNSEIAVNALLWNGKGRFSCFRQEIDAIYIPEKHKNTFQGLAAIFKKHDIPDDIAVPTILRSLDLESSFLSK